MNSTELTHLMISWITLSFAFAVDTAFIGINEFLIEFPLTLIALGTGFVFHELAHRQIAKNIGCHAEYRAWMPGLLLAVGLAIFTRGGLIFAAPGAVYISGKMLTSEENGKISLAGPAMNILVGLGFLFLLFNTSVPVLQRLGAIGAGVNLFLAAFNLIPFPPLDGSKVFQWNPLIWLIAIAIPGAILSIFFF